MSMSHFAYLVRFSTGPTSVIYGRQKSAAVKVMELDCLDSNSSSAASWLWDLEQVT